MTDQPKPPPDLLAATDQLMAMLVGRAPLYGAYYRALRAAGCSKRLARQLVRDMHHAIDLQDNSTEDTP